MEGLLIDRQIQRLNLRLGGLRTIRSVPCFESACFFDSLVPDY